MAMIGVSFGSKHSYNDWHVYLDGFQVDYPEPQRYMIEVPLRHGVLDVTSSLTGGNIFYKNRKIKIDFKVIDNPLPWQELYSMIARDIHGKSLQIVYDMDPFFYWTAYDCQITSQSSDEDVGSFTIECDCYPFKREIEEKVVTYTLTTDVSNITKVVTNLKEKVTPEFNITGNNLTITHGGKNYSNIIADSTYHPVAGLELSEGKNSIKFTRPSGVVASRTTIKVKFRRGDL